MQEEEKQEIIELKYLYIQDIINNHLDEFLLNNITGISITGCKQLLCSSFLLEEFLEV
jgi:hypothetical protein